MVRYVKDTWNIGRLVRSVAILDKRSWAGNRELPIHFHENQESLCCFTLVAPCYTFIFLSIIPQQATQNVKSPLSLQHFPHTFSSQLVHSLAHTPQVDWLHNSQLSMANAKVRSCVREQMWHRCIVCGFIEFESLTGRVAGAGSGDRCISWE